MSERETNSVTFDSEDASEQRLWNDLRNLPRGEPSAGLRQNFYSKLDRAGREGPAVRIGRWLGLSGGPGWLTAAACVLFGLGLGQTLNLSASADSTRLLALEQNVAMLSRELILDRLQDATPSQRLRGVIDAGSFVEGDTEIARALLARATGDNVLSVRSAAIDALGPRLTSTEVGDELMKLLEDAESPLIQLALVDLVLRNGSESQLQQLLLLASRGRLHPDLAKHVQNSMGSESV